VKVRPDFESRDPSRLSGRLKGCDQLTRERILVVDDEPNMAWLFKQTFPDLGEILSADSGEKALEMAGREDISLVMLDQRLPGMDGLETLKNLRARGYGGPVIMMTAYGEVKSAVEAMKLGAHDYVTKPFDLEELRLIMEGALRYSSLTREVSRLKHEVEERFHVRNIVTVSPKMLSLFGVIERISSSDVSVLIQGESGTGKELLAKAIHYGSHRRDKPFVPVNCAALPENLLESELFGYEEGAFSGARRRKPGKFELAGGGTVFLDEVADLPLSMQPKILRVLEDKLVERLGGTKPVEVDLRVVAATNRDLKNEVQEGRFRRDLYFRLAVIPITIPPLRERKEDIPILLRHFLRESCERIGRPLPLVSREAMEHLVSYHWPGNVRELKNLAQQISLLCDQSVIRPKDLPAPFLQGESGGDGSLSPETKARGRPFPQTIQDAASCVPPCPSSSLPLKDLKEKSWNAIEMEKIQEALELFKGNRTRAAAYLGISRRSLQAKIKKYGL